MKINGSLDDYVAAWVGGSLGVVVPMATCYFLTERVLDNIDLNQYLEWTTRVISYGGTGVLSHQIGISAGALFGVLSWRTLKNFSESLTYKVSNSFKRNRSNKPRIKFK